LSDSNLLNKAFDDDEDDDEFHSNRSRAVSFAKQPPKEPIDLEAERRLSVGEVGERKKEEPKLIIDIEKKRTKTRNFNSKKR